MGEPQDLEIVAAGLLEVAPDGIWQIDPLVVRVVRISNVRKIQQDLLAVGKIDQAAVSIADGIERRLFAVIYFPSKGVVGAVMD